MAGTSAGAGQDPDSDDEDGRSRPSYGRLLPRNEVLEASARFLGYGLTFALSTLAFLLLGSWADGRLGTEPALTFVGGVVGAAAGFWYMYVNIVLSADREHEEDRK